MSRRPVVVDGSNLATEGRSTPSLAQLDEAVRAWLAENPDDEVIVVVDASFGYRIDEAEQKMFEEAEEAGELVSPPAGAAGRGDGFLLRIADRVDAAVLSNDSFQEFHGDYPWLFDSGRLLGGKPVPGVGWIFTPRTPVRGPKSRMAVRDAKRTKKPARSEPVVEAIAEATAEAMEPAESSKGRPARRRGGRAPARHEAINEPLPFITFIAEHPLGTEVEGEVDSFTSHGAFVLADGARCYVPVSGLGDPPPRTAKAVLKRGESHRFVVQALDPPRRGIELALPGLARVAGAPTEETVEAEIAGAHGGSPEPSPDGEAPRRRRRGRRGAPADDGQAESPEPGPAELGATEPSVDVPIAQGSEAAAAVGADTPPPPARRRTRKSAAEAAEAPPARARAGRAKKAAADEPPRAEAPPPPPRAEAPPAPPRARRSKKAAPEVAPATEAAAVETPPAASRRRAKKAAATVDAPAPEPRPEAAAPPARKRARKAAVAEAAPAPSTPEAAPAPPRARRSKKAAADAPSDQPPADAPVEAKPRRTTNKTAAKAAAPAKKAAKKRQAPPSDARAADAGDEQASPARRRRTSKAGG